MIKYNSQKATKDEDEGSAVSCQDSFLAAANSFFILLSSFGPPVEIAMQSFPLWEGGRGWEVGGRWEEAA